MYTARMCHNAVLVDSTRVVIFQPTHNYLGKNCLPCQRGLPSNGAKKLWLYGHTF